MKKRSLPYEKHRVIESPTIDPALANIRQQLLRLDSKEKLILQRILRRAELLDTALADLHLILPVVQICFYGIRSGCHAGHALSPTRLRRLMRQ